MGLHIITTMWGKDHVEQFKSVALRSLTWPKNLESLKAAKAQWNIFTDDEYFDEIKRSIPKEITLNLRSTSTLRDYVDPAQSSFLWQIKECLKGNHKLLVAPGDLMFGEGTIPNLLKIGQDRETVVVVPHIRVLPEFLTHTNHPLTNAKMVALAFKYLHRSWIDAERGAFNQTSFHGGVEWERLEDNLYAVTHRLPAPYLMEFTAEDLSYFLSTPNFNSLDHSWPGDILIPRGRQRFVASSDLCFLIEPTDKFKNIPNVLPNAPADGRGFHRKQIHNNANAQVTAIFRGE